MRLLAQCFQCVKSFQFYNLIFKTSLKLNLKIIFKILGIVLVFVGAELFGEGFAKLIPTAGEVHEEGGSILFGGFSLI